MAVIFIFYEVFNYGKACIAWSDALKKYPFQKEESIRQLKSQYRELKENPVFLTTYGKALAWNGSPEEAKEILNRATGLLPCSESYIESGKVYAELGLDQQAFSCWETAGYMVPARFTPLFLSMKLYEQRGNNIRAIELANRILTRKEKTDHPGVDEMKQEARRIREFLSISTDKERPVMR